jgi:hypothetical protein
MNPNDTSPNFNLSLKQISALLLLQSRGWILELDTLHKLPGSSEFAIAIGVTGKETGMKMCMVIEPDGYTHS